MTQTELTLEEKARLMKNEYQRKWAKKNRDKIKQYQLKALAKMYDRTHGTEAGESDDR